jgi:CubicO group peptidase (beta-lactamase class C family)
MIKTYLKNAIRVIVILLISVQSAFSQQAVTRIDSLFKARYSNAYFNGNVLIAQDGAILYQNSFGYADREKKILNTKTSRSHLASTSKLFTAVAILQLKDKGLIRLSDPVVNYLPDFPYATITIRHLITHTSGLPDFQIFEPYYKEDPKRILTNKDLIPAIKKYGKLLFEPGERWSYSSPGTALLAVILEKVSHLKFEQYLKKHIWDVSGMHNTYINSLSAVVEDEKRVKNYAWPTIFSDDVQIADSIPRHREFAQISGALIGPGLVVSDVHDLFMFDQALYAGKLLKPATMDEAFTPIKLNNGADAQTEPFLGKTAFGLGWFIFTEDPLRKIVLHTGKQGGIITVFIRDITKKRTYILLDNSESKGLNNLTLNVMNILDNKPLIIAKESLAYTYAKDISKRGIDFALSHFNQSKSDTLHYYFNFFEMVYVSYELIATGKTAQGLETLRLLTLIDANNWYPYFAYGKTLLEMGKKDEATMSLKKALQLSPENKEVMPLLKQIEGN